MGELLRCSPARSREGLELGAPAMEALRTHRKTEGRRGTSWISSPWGRRAQGGGAAARRRPEVEEGARAHGAEEQGAMEGSYAGASGPERPLATGREELQRRGRRSRGASLLLAMEGSTAPCALCQEQRRKKGRWWSAAGGRRRGAGGTAPWLAEGRSRPGRHGRKGAELPAAREEEAAAVGKKGCWKMAGGG